MVSRPNRVLTPLNGPRKSAFHLLFNLPKASFGSMQFTSNLQVSTHHHHGEKTDDRSSDQCQLCIVHSLFASRLDPTVMTCCNWTPRGGCRLAAMASRSNMKAVPWPFRSGKASIVWTMMSHFASRIKIDLCNLARTCTVETSR